MAIKYQPITLSEIAGHLATAANNKIRWKLIWEFLEEYRWEPAPRNQGSW